MFFIGQSGYIITLLLTAFLPLFMLVAKPGPGHQHAALTASGPVTSHFFRDHFLKLSAQKEFIKDIEINPVIPDKLIPPTEQILKKRVFHYLCVFVVPTLLNNPNKAPPAI